MPTGLTRPGACSRTAARRPLRDLRLHGPRRQDAHAGTQRHGFLDSSGCCRNADQIDLDSLRAQEPVQLMADLQVLVEPDEVQPLQVAGYTSARAARWCAGGSAPAFLLRARESRRSPGPIPGSSPSPGPPRRRAPLRKSYPAACTRREAARLGSAPRTLPATGSIRKARWSISTPPARPLAQPPQGFQRQPQLLFPAQYVAAEFVISVARRRQFQGPLAAIKEGHSRRRSTSCTCWLAADWLTPQCAAPLLMLRVVAISLKRRCSRMP